MKPVAQQYIESLSPYQPGLPIELVARNYGLDPGNIIKLASNENPWGMSPKAKVALALAAQEVHRYPDQYGLTRALAKKLGVEPGAIVLGNGSNDVLDLVARTFLSQGDQAISSQYAFAIYPIVTQAAGAQNVIVPANNYGHDLGVMLAAVTPQTKVIWLANPNNPTGTFVPYKEVRSFLAGVQASVLVVLDEAYYEYLDDTEQSNAIEWIGEFPNLVIIRTFSKVYGLAGLRIGYGVASPEVAELLNRVRQPFNGNVLALAAATAALEDDAFVAQSRRNNVVERERLVRAFADMKLGSLPAHGNFVTIKVPNAAEVHQSLLRKGIIIRPLVASGMPEHLRITVGTPADNKRLLTALHKILNS